MDAISRDILSGDHSRQSKAVLKLERLCWKWARHYSQGNMDVTRDLVQEGFLAIWEAIPEYNGSTRFNTFVHRKVQDRIQRTRPGFLRAVSISPEKYKEAQKYQEHFERVTHEEGKFPSFEKVCSDLGFNKLSQQGLRPLVSRDVGVDDLGKADKNTTRPDIQAEFNESWRALKSRIESRLSPVEQELLTDYAAISDENFNKWSRERGVKPSQMRSELSRIMGKLR
jgi:RNA polymerase sigma factor (sigma-70 family)